MDNQNDLVLTSYEGKICEIPKQAAINSTYLTEEIKKLTENNNTIVLKEISFEVLEKVCEFLSYYKAHKIDDKDIEPIPDEGLKKLFDEWDLKFVDTLELEIVFDLINAAEMLGITKLHDLTCAKIAEFMKNKSPDEISKTFTIECHIPEDEYNKLQANS